MTIPNLRQLADVDFQQIDQNRWSNIFNCDLRDAHVNWQTFISLQ